MIGYLKPNRREMPPQWREQYRGIYCGLCHGLKKRYGLRGIACLSYELTGFLMVILAMGEEEVELFHGACCVSPLLHVPYVNYLDDLVLRTADVSVAVAGLEIADNVADEGTLKWRLAQRLLRTSVEKAEQRLEGGFARMAAGAEEYYTLERSPEGTFTELITAGGGLIEAILEPVIASCPAEQRGPLRRLANGLGRWICVADACDDACRDRETGASNLLDGISDPRFVEQILDSLHGEIESCLSELPIRRFRELIQWVLGTQLRQTGERVRKKYESGVNPDGSTV